MQCIAWYTWTCWSLAAGPFSYPKLLKTLKIWFYYSNGLRTKRNLTPLEILSHSISHSISFRNGEKFSSKEKTTNERLWKHWWKPMRSDEKADEKSRWKLQWRLWWNFQWKLWCKRRWKHAANSHEMWHFLQQSVANLIWATARKLLARI